MVVGCTVLIGVAGILFALVQFPNLLRRSIRTKTSLVCVLVAVAAAGTAFALRGAEVAAIGIVVWAFAGIGLSGKWFYEVQEDVTAREENGLPVLLPSRVIPVSWRSVFSGVYQLRYRSRMFKDPWSRRYLIGLSQPLPRSLMDEPTVSELAAAYREQDEQEQQ
jgi:hypothetical protein